VEEKHKKQSFSSVCFYFISAKYQNKRLYSPDETFSRQSYLEKWLWPTSVSPKAALIK